MRIRKFSEKDISRFIELAAQLGYDVSEEQFKDRYQCIKDDDDHGLLVAVDENDEVVGWVHAAVDHSLLVDKRAIILGLVVDLNHRKGGIGRDLMNAAENWAKERDCMGVRLNSGATRTEAHQFYENLGYQNIKTQLAFQKMFE